LIDRIRHDIQQRLEQLLAEADKLRHALVALDPRERNSPTPEASKPPPAAKRYGNTQEAPKVTPARGVGASNGEPSSRRTRPGETKLKVLAALSRDQGLTAGEVAEATGLARSTVSTTLSRLSKSGDVVKADRGYHLPSATGTP
jgi:DNA-binding transcriptional ArsR family regulator